MTGEILGCAGVTLRRGKRVVFHDFAASFGAGVTVLLGPNGAGKATLLKAIASLDTNGTGTLRLEGSPVAIDSRGRRRLFSSVGYMPQDWRHVPGYTVAESVEYAGWLKGLRSDVIRDTAASAIDVVGLTTQIRARVSKLSGGAQQRVGLAEALVADPRILVLDEPTVGLDPEQRARFRSILRSRSAETCTLMSTHLTDDAAAVADRILVLANGAVLFDGSPDELSAIGRGSPVERGNDIEKGYLMLTGALESA